MGERLDQAAIIVRLRRQSENFTVLPYSVN